MSDDEQARTVMPGWDHVLDAGSVPPVKPVVLTRARPAVREAAAEEVASPSTRKAKRWPWRLSLAAAGGGAAIAGVLTFALVGGSPEPRPVPEAAPSSEAVTGTGALRDDGFASCAEAYDLETLRDRAFAFDGTVLAIAEGDGNLVHAAVTFEVHEWFRGGGDSEVTIAMMPPGTLGKEELMNEWLPAYSVGTRLLVTGEPRWGGAPLDDAVAWTCGFTRYHDEATAAQWREALTGFAGPVDRSGPQLGVVAGPYRGVVRGFADGPTPSRRPSGYRPADLPLRATSDSSSWGHGLARLELRHRTGVR